MRITLLSIIACNAILLCSGQSSAASSNDTDGTIDERLTHWPELSIQAVFSDVGQPEVQLTYSWPVGSRTFATFDAVLGIWQGSALAATNVSFGMFHRPHPALLFGASVHAANSEQGFQGSFTASTSWNGVAGGVFLSTSANVNYSKATGWNFDALASGDFPVGEDITGYAEVWLLGTGKLNWGAALGVTLPILNGSEATLQIYRDFGEFPVSGFLAEFYGSLGDNSSLTVSAAWEKDLITGSRDFTLSFDTKLSLSNAVSLGLSGSSVVTDSHMFSSEAQFDVTFERENGSFALSAAKSGGDYQNTTFAIEWVSRW